MRALLLNRWALAPVLLLLASMSFAAFAVTMALKDPGALAAEPDYYRRGVAYDAYKHQIAENGALGWVVTPAIVAAHANGGLARLEIAAADKFGIALDGAQVTAEVIPIRQADARVTLTLEPLGGGRYGSDVPMRIGGQWEVRVEFDRDGRVFSDRFRRQVRFGAPNAASDLPLARKGE